jgi:hypothetical protein
MNDINQFLTQIKDNPELQSQVFETLKDSETMKKHSEQVAKTFFDENVRHEHKKIYDFVDSAITSEGIEKPDGMKTSEFVQLLAKKNKEMSEQLNSLTSDFQQPEELKKQLEELQSKFKTEKNEFMKTAQSEIENRENQIKELLNEKNNFVKQTELQKVLSTLQFNKGLDETLINDIISMKTTNLIQNAKIEDGSIVWCKSDGTPYKDGILNADIKKILEIELNSVLHKSTAGGNAKGQVAQTSANFDGNQVFLDPSTFKTREQFLNEFDKVAKSQGITKGEKYDSLFWDAFKRYDIETLREF